MRRNHVPSYSLHKASGLAVARHRGRDYYFGKFGTPESRRKYADFLARITAGEADPTPPASPAELTVAELVVRYSHFAAGYYQKNGEPTKQIERVRRSLAIAVRLFASTPAASFGPASLALVRDEMVKLGWSRKHVNSCVGCVRRCWRWGASVELVPATAHAALATLDGLRAGRTDAPETEPLRPVPEADLAAALAFMSGTIAGMVRVQLLAGMRAGEVCGLRAGEIDRSADVWLYAPADHKTAHAGRSRVILFGPRAQEILRPRLEQGGYLFSPARAAAEHALARRAARRSKVQPSQEQRRVSEPKRAPGDCYTSNSYNQAIRRACEAAGVRPFRAHQLRHSAATMLRREFGVEVALVVLGHAHLSTTEIYARPNLEKAIDAIRQVG